MLPILENDGEGLGVMWTYGVTRVEKLPEIFPWMEDVLCKYVEALAGAIEEVKFLFDRENNLFVVTWVEFTIAFVSDVLTDCVSDSPNRDVRAPETFIVEEKLYLNVAVGISLKLEVTTADMFLD